MVAKLAARGGAHLCDPIGLVTRRGDASFAATPERHRNVIAEDDQLAPGVGGVIYCARSAIDSGAYDLLDMVVEETFIDETVLIGMQSLSCAVKCQRGRQIWGRSQSRTIRSGRIGGGGLTISPPTPGKMAA